MARYGREYRGGPGGYDASYGRGGNYHTSDFRTWGEQGRREEYDRGYGEGWGMTGLYQHMMHGPAGVGRGGYQRRYDSPFGEIAVGQPHRAGRGEGRRRFTGMESNRQRGVYGSDFRVGYSGEYSGYTGGPGGQGSRGRTRSPGWRG